MDSSSRKGFLTEGQNHICNDVFCYLINITLDYHSVSQYFGHLELLTITPANSTILIFLLVILFIISFLLSGARIAFFSMTYRDIDLLKTRTQPSYRRIVSLMANPRVLYTSMLIGHTLVNIGIILIANSLLNDWVYRLIIPGWISALIKVVFITLVVVLFGEILPKVWATHHKIWFASTASMPVELCNRIFFKLSSLLVRLNDRVALMAGKTGKGQIDRQLETAIDSLPDDEASLDEKQILKGIRKFGSTTVKQTMRTRLDVSGIEVNNSFSHVLGKVREMIYSRLPVYKGNLDEIAGILHTKDILPYIDQQEFDWKSLLRPVFYVHEQKMIEDLLQEFRQKRIHLAVVVDEFGGTSGIITLEDIMEEIIGDIQDEFDDEQEHIIRLDDRNFIFEGKMMTNDVCRVLHLPQGTFDDWRGDSDSLAGLILEIAGQFPEVNDEIKVSGFTFRPLEINKNRILKVKLTLPDAS